MPATGLEPAIGCLCQAVWQETRPSPRTIAVAFSAPTGPTPVEFTNFSTRDILLSWPAAGLDTGCAVLPARSAKRHLPIVTHVAPSGRDLYCLSRGSTGLPTPSVHPDCAGQPKRSMAGLRTVAPSCRPGHSQAYPTSWAPDRPPGGIDWVDLGRVRVDLNHRPSLTGRSDQLSYWSWPPSTTHNMRPSHCIVNSIGGNSLLRASLVQSC